MAKFSLVGTKVLIDGLTVEKYLAKQKALASKAKKGNAVVRTVVLRYFSDFISQQGLLRETTKSGNFANPAARPDIQGSLQAFRKTFGVEFQPTEVTGRTAEAFAELKQRTSASRAVTLTSIQLSGDTLGNFTNTFKLKRDTNEAGDSTFIGQRVDKIPKSQLLSFINNDQKLKNNIIQAISQKFENFIVIDYLDKEHNNRPKIKVLTNAKNILNLINLDSDTIDIEGRVVKDGTRNKAFIKLEFKLSKSGYDLFIKNATDATQKFHASLSKDVSNRFIKYAITRFQSGNARSDAAIFLQEVISIAKEFEVGSDTPVVYETQVPQQAQGSNSLSVTFKSRPQKATRSPIQVFISGIQWTVLTQKRLGETMQRLGEPEPPELKERSGRFRKSIQVVPNYRIGLLQYTYNPLYKSLERYGYKPDRQIQTAIREVAQALYVQKFRVVRSSNI